MMLAAALLLLAPVQNGEDLVSLGLRYLARHQTSQGSWGLRPGFCDCPDEPVRPDPPVDTATRVRVETLIHALDDDDARRRDQAFQDLVAIGPAALAPLRGCESKGPAERQWRCRAALRRLYDPGSPDDVELTAQAVVAFLGAGFSPLSKDVFDGRCFGTIVESGLQWLMEQQKADGSFGAATPAAEAWATLALSEAFGMTNRAVYREPAQRAITCIATNPATDARGLFYQGMALKSGELSDLNYPRGTAERVATALAVRRADEPASIFNRATLEILKIFTYRNKRLLDLSGLPGLDPSRMEMETIYAVGMALFQADGPHGPHWKAYNEREKGRILSAQEHVHGRCDRGSWSAAGTRERIKTAALATLSREIYYR